MANYIGFDITTYTFYSYSRGIMLNASRESIKDWSINQNRAKHNIAMYVYEIRRRGVKPVMRDTEYWYSASVGLSLIVV